MCRGGQLLADFSAGADERPDVPDIVEPSLTTTVDGRCVVWAHKVAHVVRGEFRPLTSGPAYPTDAIARCRMGYDHEAPEPSCSCGFHAVSSPDLIPYVGTELVVVLSGRVLAFEWTRGVLYRAERQTVVRVGTTRDAPFESFGSDGNGDPDGRAVRRRSVVPHGVGPVRLTLPDSPSYVEVDDDAGYCIAAALPSPVGDSGLLLNA